MFATHYHELTELATKYDNIQNLSVAVAEEGSNVVFLHNIVDGPASKSYGIHVAKIAGVPEIIRRNARLKLKELESGQSIVQPASEQLSFFAESFDGINTEKDDSKAKELINKIAGLDINVMTPLKAMNA